MIKKPRTRAKGATSLVPPARQVAAFIARFDPPVAKLARAARAALRKRWPTAVELVYDNYNALAIGWSPSERMSDVFVSLAIYSRAVNLYFMYGVELPDPDKLLQGSGNRGRFLRLDRLAQLEEPAVDALLVAAVSNGDTPLPPSGRGHTIIKAVSARQRARRSARSGGSHRPSCHSPARA